jgi:hypothetical protein
LSKTFAAPPSTTLSWSAAGLHVTVALLAPHDEQAIRVATQARGVTMGVLGDYQPHAAFPPTLILGYSQLTGSSSATPSSPVAPSSKWFARSEPRSAPLRGEATSGRPSPGAF